MTTKAFRQRLPEQCTLSKEDQQHILRISKNGQELLHELMSILRQLRPLPPRGASVRHTTVDVTDATGRVTRCAWRRHRSLWFFSSGEVDKAVRDAGAWLPPAPLA
jgi:hypothetical protein